VLVLVAVLLWRGSDAAATSSTTAAPAALPGGGPSGDLAVGWSVDGGPVPRQVVEGGRVVVGDAHGIRAVDPLTGAEAWHYTRSNAALCGLTATQGVVVAVFRTASRCDEAVALRAGTGVYAWTRNLDLRPDATLDGSGNVALARSPTGVLTLDPVNDNVRWREHAPSACTYVDTAVGGAGVAVAQRCGSAPALQLRLLAGGNGSQRWTADLPDLGGTPVRVAVTDDLVAVLGGDRLQVFAAADGAPLATAPLPAATGGTDADPLLARTVDDDALFYARGTALALDRLGAVRWSVPARGLPAGGGAAAGTAPTVLVPDAGALVRRDLGSGDEVGRLAVRGDLPAGGSAETAGPAVVYRLPDRVLGLT
jgi:outer membrane protein assembly factor BamB